MWNIDELNNLSVVLNACINDVLLKASIKPTAGGSIAQVRSVICDTCLGILLLVMLYLFVCSDDDV